ncbi:MAG: LysM domain-containing protein [Nocardioidaceae bacterium]|nr:LysM domain-containing protein [Nocardioidaceae bacterium]
MSTLAVPRTSIARTAATRTAATGTVRTRARRPVVQPSAPVRLTRRGRLVVLLAALALVALASVVLGSSVVATDEGSAPAVARTVTIQPEQTLWDLAREAAPGADPRTVVNDIVELNALTGGGDVQPGQRVALPAY